MNEIAAPEGYDGGGPSHLPIPDIDYEPIDVDVDSVQSLAKALIMQADNVKTAAGDIKAKMELDASGKLSETTHLPVGGGNQDLSLTAFARSNSERMAEIGTFLDNVETSLRGLGNLSAMIAQKYGDVDGLNGADVDEVRQLLGNQAPTEHDTEV